MALIHKLVRRPLAMAVALAAVAFATPGAQAIGLLQAYQAALQNDPTYLAAFQELEAGRENRIIGRSQMLPNVSASYSASRNHSDLTVAKLTTHPEYYSRSASVSLRQPLFNLDVLARYKQGVAQTNYSEALFVSRTHEMIVRVAGAYIDALYANVQVNLSRAQRDVLLEQKKVNDHLFAKGEGTKTDMLETQARLDVAEAQLLESQDNLQTQRATLAGLIGQEVDSLDDFGDFFRITPLPEGGYEALRKTALENNPELVAQAFAIEAAKQEVNKNRAGHAPRLDFVASYSKSNAETINTYNQESTGRAIGLQLNVPLFSGGYTSAVTRQAAAGLEKTRFDMQAKQDKVLVELRKQYAAVVSGATKILALDKAVASNTLLIKATEQSIKGGVRINLDLLNAQQQLYATQRDLAQARYTYLLAQLRLRAAAGTLGVDDVREIAAYFR